MPQIPPPRDSMGHLLKEGDLVVLHPTQNMKFRVVRIDNGGIQLPQGVTPTVVVLESQITLRGIPGAPFSILDRVSLPKDDELGKLIDIDS